MSAPRMRRSDVQNLLACEEWRGAPGSEAAMLGVAAHAAIARYLSACIAQHAEAITDRETLDALAAEAFNEEARGLHPALVDEVRSLLRRFAATHSAGLETLLGVELYLEADVGFVTLTGTLDRLDRADGRARTDPEPVTAVRVTDWKTGWTVSDHTWQLRFYGALVAASMPSVEEVALRADNIRLTEGVREYGYTRAELLGFLDEVTEALAARSARPKRGPTGGTVCAFCAKRFTCGAAVAPFNAAPETEAQAAELFGELLRLDAAADERRDALRAFFEAREPSVLNGYEVGYLRPRSPSFRAGGVAEVEAWLRDNGLFPEQYLSVNAARIPQGIKRRMLADGVASLDEEAKPQFKWRRAGDDSGE